MSPFTLTLVVLGAEKGGRSSELLPPDTTPHRTPEASPIRSVDQPHDAFVSFDLQSQVKVDEGERVLCGEEDGIVLPGGLAIGSEEVLRGLRAAFPTIECAGCKLVSAMRRIARLIPRCNPVSPTHPWVLDNEIRVPIEIRPYACRSVWACPNCFFALRSNSFLRTGMVPNRLDTVMVVPGWEEGVKTRSRLQKMMGHHGPPTKCPTPTHLPSHLPIRREEISTSVESEDRPYRCLRPCGGGDGDIGKLAETA